ncbi:MAG: hypothetical protein AB4062_11805 [Crocosphaera sp.]
MCNFSFPTMRNGKSNPWGSHRVLEKGTDIPEYQPRRGDRPAFYHPLKARLTTLLLLILIILILLKVWQLPIFIYEGGNGAFIAIFGEELGKYEQIWQQCLDCFHELIGGNDAA